MTDDRQQTTDSESREPKIYPAFRWIAEAFLEPNSRHFRASGNRNLPEHRTEQNDITR